MKNHLKAFASFLLFATVVGGLMILFAYVVGEI